VYANIEELWRTCEDQIGKDSYRKHKNYIKGYNQA